MFFGSLMDFIFPNFISQVVNKAQENKFDEIDQILLQWIVIMLVSAFCGAIRDLLMGWASQRLGGMLRVSLFEALVNQDVAFFDDNRTGDILSRIGSDTQVVQDGLT